MANHCHCTLNITGSIAELQRLKHFNKSKEEVLDFNKLAPVPDSFTTAWAPPVNWLIAATEKFLTLKSELGFFVPQEQSGVAKAYDGLLTVDIEEEEDVFEEEYQN